MVERGANLRQILRANFRDDNDAFLALVSLDTERDHVPCANAVDRSTGPFDVLGKNVPAAHDDDILDAAAEHELAVDGVRKISCAQPALSEERSGRIGTLVVA